jgi:hypothetical protein
MSKESIQYACCSFNCQGCINGAYLASDAKRLALAPRGICELVELINKQRAKELRMDLRNKEYDSNSEARKLVDLRDRVLFKAHSVKNKAKTSLGPLDRKLRTSLNRIHTSGHWMLELDGSHSGTEMSYKQLTANISRSTISQPKSQSLQSHQEQIAAWRYGIEASSGRDGNTTKSLPTGPGSPNMRPLPQRASFAPLSATPILLPLPVKSGHLLPPPPPDDLPPPPPLPLNNSIQ